ncbi:MAG: hypothetical protein WDM70_02330 [Nitrosomonadales bacterium]
MGCATPYKTELEQIIIVSRPVGNVPIVVSYLGGAFYRVQVNNTLPATISLLWDESSYITTTGESVRIIHLLNKYAPPQNPPVQQTSSFIPSNSQFQADFTGGRLARLRQKKLHAAAEEPQQESKNVSDIQHQR